MSGKRTRATRRGHNTAAIGARTRARILDVAERLFAERGPEAVSVRSIAAAAKVGLYAVNYHFGSKERLLQAVFQRRVGPLNEARIALLDAAVAAAGPDGLPPLEAVIEAMVTPSMRLLAEASASARAVVVMQFLARAFSLPGEDDFHESQYEPMRSRFIALVRRILPALTRDDILWRYNFLVGAMLYAMGGPIPIAPRKKGGGAGNAEALAAQEAIQHIVRYAAAGFRAPPAGT